MHDNNDNKRIKKRKTSRSPFEIINAQKDMTAFHGLNIHVCIYIHIYVCMYGRKEKHIPN
jgi:hypothetical protein